MALTATPCNYRLPPALAVARFVRVMAQGRPGAYGVVEVLDVVPTVLCVEGATTAASNR